MHIFDDLIYTSTAFTLKLLEETNSKGVEELQTGASMNAVKNLQMIQLQKAISLSECFQYLNLYYKKD